MSIRSENPDDVMAHLDRGIELDQSGHHEEALAAFDRALELDPDYVSAHTNRGVVLFNLRRYEEALAAYDRALELAPDALAHTNRGAVLLNLKRYEEALAAHDRALGLDPDYVSAHTNRGVALSNLGRHEEALAAFDRALALNPDLAEAHNNRGFALGSLGRYEEALAEYEYCIQMQHNVLDSYKQVLALSTVLYDIERNEIDYAAQVQTLGGNGNEDDFWFILKQEIEEEIFYHVLLTKAKAGRRSDQYDQVSGIVEHLLNLNPINLIFGGGFLVGILKERIDVKYDRQQKRDSLKIVDTLGDGIWDAENISDFADGLSERISARCSPLLPQLSQQGMFDFIKFCVQRLFMPLDIGRRKLSAEDRFLFNLVNGVGGNVSVEVAITPEQEVKLQVEAKERPTIPSELIVKSGLLVDGQRFVHPANPGNPLNYFAPSTLEEARMLGYIKLEN